MDQKVILITGASRGIGAGMLARFAAAGHRVILNYAHSESEADALYQRLCSAAGAANIMKSRADVSNRNEVHKMFDAIYARFGTLDVLINNAGRNIDGPFLEMTDENWENVINTILKGTFICSQEFVRRYQGSDGHIITLGATTGIKGRKNGVNYCSAKAGVLTMTKCLALELAPRIKVNCITPGFVETDEVMTRYHLYEASHRAEKEAEIPLGRLGETDDIWRVADFIINGSSYITGHNFMVTGGQHLG